MEAEWLREKGSEGVSVGQRALFTTFVLSNRHVETKGLAAFRHFLGVLGIVLHNKNLESPFGCLSVKLLLLCNGGENFNVGDHHTRFVRETGTDPTFTAEAAA